MAVRRVGPLPPCGFLVAQASAGGPLPISVERRAKGKRVTVIAGVQGNGKALCTTLTTLLGAGGTLHARGPQLTDIEVQGEQVERIERVLGQLGCIRDPSGRPPLKVVERECAYDDFLQREVGESGGRRKDRTRTTPVEVPEPPADAPCRAWHGFWLYCAGRCVLVDTDDVWVETLGPEPPLLQAQGFDCRRASVDLDVALGRLGMRATVGEAVGEWLAHRAHAEKQRLLAAERAAQPAMCSGGSRAQRAMPADGALVCEVCGAVFGMRKTLELHRKQHRRTCDDRAANLEAPRGLASDIVGQSGQFDREELAQNTSQSVLAQDGWPEWRDSDAESHDDSGLDAEAARYLASACAPAGGLASWIDAARVKSKRPKRQSKAGSVPCPLCGELFKSSEIEQHADVCAAAASLPSTSSAPSSGGGGKERGHGLGTDERAADGDGDCLPPELLESLLEMELSVEQGQSFWRCYETRRADRRHELAAESFLSALEAALAGGAESDGDVSTRRVEDETSGVGDSIGRPSGQAQAEAVACPVCGVAQPVQLIERHVEQCLSAMDTADQRAAAAAGRKGAGKGRRGSGRRQLGP